MPPAKQFLLDGGLAAALLAALAIVFAADRHTDSTQTGVADGGTSGEAPESRGNLLRPKTALTTMKADSVYAERTSPDREVAVVKRGGSPISEQAVQRGMDWLARHQAQDGSWSDQCLGSGRDSMCVKGGPCNNPGGHFPVAQTGLALLAFQGGGHYYFNESAYAANVKRGLDWLVAHQRADGNLVPSIHGHYMYEHAIGTFALAEACALARHAGEEPDPRYMSALRMAVKYLEKAQHDDGGWRYNDSVREASDTSVSGWVVLALKSAKEADASPDPAGLDRAIRYFKTCEFGDGQTGYQGRNMISEATTGVGMLVQHFLVGKSDSSLVKVASKHLAGYAEQTWGAGRGAVDYYTWYNGTLGMFLAGGEPWERWNKVVRDRVVGLQVNQGCERGSWPPSDRWGNSGGRVYSTSLAILTLEVYYRFARKDDAKP
jgi:hypothetical protein